MDNRTAKAIAHLHQADRDSWDPDPPLTDVARSIEEDVITGSMVHSHKVCAEMLQAAALYRLVALIRGSKPR